MKILRKKRYLRFKGGNSSVIEIMINTNDYVNVYEIRQAREWWEKLTKPKLFKIMRIRFWNIWYEFLYIMRLSKYGH